MERVVWLPPDTQVFSQSSREAWSLSLVSDVCRPAVSIPGCPCINMVILAQFCLQGQEASEDAAGQREAALLNYILCEAESGILDLATASSAAHYQENPSG
jgi:hypothetical protein